MSTPENDRLIDNVVHALQSMTSAQMAHRLMHFVSKDIAFSDPRLSCHGGDNLTAAFRSLFDGTEGMIMRVTDRAWGQDGRTVYLRWDRLLKLPGGGKQAYTGISEIVIGVDGKIAAMVDHWDAQDHSARPQKSILARLTGR